MVQEAFIFPLSFGQERLWFLEQLVPGTALYNLPALAFRLSGPLDVAALEGSLNEIVRRHETLRTTFGEVDGKPVQIINPTGRLNMPVLDLSHLVPEQREAEALRIAIEEVQRPFDLVRGPLFRVSLLRLAAEEHILIAPIHHIISDGWSLGVLLRELDSLYKAFAAGQPSPLSELPIQYADFALWQREWLQGRALDERLAYWRRQLADIPPLLELPTDHPRPPISTFQGVRQSFMLPTTLTDRLKALSRQEGATLFMTLLAAFNTLLHRYAGQQDIVVGSPIASRNQPGVEELIGFFVNMLVLRSELSGNPSFRELLRRVREVALDAYEHQDMPFEKLVDELQPGRDMSRNPLFQVAFALQYAPLPSLKLADLTLIPLDVHTETAKFDLTLDVWESPEGIQGRLECSADLFDPATNNRMIGHFQTLLKGIVADPNQKISELPILTEAEQRQLLLEWNSTAALYPADKTVHELFEEQAARTPDAVAVVFRDKQLNFSELNRRANQVARYLQRLSVDPETLVGICLERSVEMIVGIIGILKAGCAYVPLDPALPKERLGFIVADAKSPVILTTQPLIGKLPVHGARVICLDTEWPEIGQERVENLAYNARPQNLAYVLYTSGSTGKPKGVMVEHRNVLALLCGFEQVAPSHEQLAGTAVCPFSFDVSVWEFFSTLCFGGSLHVLLPDQFGLPERFVSYLVDHQINSAYIPPALLPDVASHLERLDGSVPLDRILVGVEPIKQGTLQRFRNLSGKLRIVNGYGPTETTVCATFFKFRGMTDPERRTPIGTAVPGYDVYLVDPDLKPVPIGVAGEILVGGAGLSRGYLNRPELTAGAFIAHPFKTDPGALVYRTGDLAHRLPDGNIVFMGRRDHQVKIRGYRVELGEIESILNTHPVVREAVVQAWGGVSNDKRLVAYIVLDAQYVYTEQSASEWHHEHISQWQTLFDGTYGQVPSCADPTFNSIGWNSSYTGQPIPEAEMREWVDHTVEQILSLRPTRVLEVGCGTGLLLFRIAPHCKYYWGTDFSQSALEHIRQHLDDSSDALLNVMLLDRPADDFEGMEPESFDAVIINSVVQYFPNLDYLVRVLEGAVALIEPGGFIFVGDVRSLPLLEAFHTSVQLHQALPSLSIAELRQRVQRHVSEETELVIAPEFFDVLKQRLPISHVEIKLRRGRHHNELTKFRYDVILHVRADDEPALEGPWLDWQQEGLTVSAVRQRLLEAAPKVLGIRCVPNERVMMDVEAVERIASQDRPETVKELWEALQECRGAGVDPEKLWALGDQLPYIIDISWSGFGVNHGCYDVVFRRRPSAEYDAEQANRPVVSFPGEAVGGKPWSDYANSPLQGMFARRLTPNLRSFLQDRLPEYMIPSAFVSLKALPLTPSGKIDRRALPVPDQVRPELESTYVAPRTPTEKKVATIWADLLGLEQVGVRDSFFEVGGHSLLAIQLMVRLHQAFRVEAPLRRFFENPTVAGVAKAIDGLRQGQNGQQAASDLLVAAEATESFLPSVLVPIQPHGTKPPLFCIHPAGGVVFPYYTLAAYLGAEQPLYGVQDPSFESKGESCTRVEDMAAQYVEALQVAQPDGAYRLLGWSFGGVVAFEMAQQLHRQGQEVALLAMIDTEAPVSGKPIPRSLSSSLKSLLERLGVYLSAAGNSLPYLRDAAYLLASSAMRRRDRTAEKPTLVEYLRWAWTAALRSYFLKQADMAQVVPQDSHLLDVRLPTVRRVLQLVTVHQQVSRKYVPQIYPGHITLFRSSQQPSWKQSYQDPSLGWDELATQGVDVSTMPGNHIVLLSEPYIRNFAQELQVCLERAQTSLKNDHHSDF